MFGVYQEPSAQTVRRQAFQLKNVTNIFKQKTYGYYIIVPVFQEVFPESDTTWWQPHGCRPALGSWMHGQAQNRLVWWHPVSYFINSSMEHPCGYSTVYNIGVKYFPFCQSADFEVWGLGGLFVDYDKSAAPKNIEYNIGRSHVF